IQWLASAQSDCRESQSIPNQMNDIRFAFRKLRQSPAFTSIAIITLALGIGLNTAIFSLINDLFLRGLPFKEPQRLVHMYSNARERNLLELAISVPRFEHYRESQTIFGVLPNLPFSWVGPAAEVWTTKPFEIAGISYERIMRGSGVLRVVGRLKPGMTLEQARAALPPLEQSYRARYPDKIDSSSVMTLKTLAEDTTGNLRPAFATLLTAVAFVLLIACSNVANLLLVRFSGRRREIALRMAIGASRRSVV